MLRGVLVKRSTILAAVALAAGLAAGPSSAAQNQPPSARAKMDSHVAAVAAAVRTGGGERAARAARMEELDSVGAAVQVVVEAAPGRRRGALTALASAGARVEAEAANLLLALVPATSLAAVAVDPAVAYVRSPLVPHADAVAGEGVTSGATNAAEWHSRGWNGAGVKIAVIDVGFAGWTSRRAEGDLPASLTTVNYCTAPGASFTADDHGTAVAEIVHEMAPRAQLYLICITNEVTFAQAAEYARANGIRIVNTSLGWTLSSRGDGSGGPGSPDATVANARANGILWVSAAGNSADRHWGGGFQDFNGNRYLNWIPGDDRNDILIPAWAFACVELKWDDWPYSDQNYDLYLTDGLTIVESSNGLQTGSQPPIEALCYENLSGADNYYSIVVRGVSGAVLGTRIDLFVQAYAFELEHQVAAGSIVEPASSPNALAVGAICWADNSLEFYSSVGPTIDGRTEPDIAAQAAVSSGTYGWFEMCADGWSGFRGTSASAPHVAGAAALVKQANPSFTVGQLQSWLESHAVDLGAAGKDSLFGSGKLALGPPQPDPSIPVNPTLTSPSHTPSAWSSDATVTVAFSGATDVGTGLDGYSYAWSTDPTTIPDATKDAEESATATTSTPLAEGSSWYFHLRTRDNWGNWSDPLHLGPFFIDPVAPTNPTLSSTSHVVGTPSLDNTIDVEIAGASDAGSGVDGYSFSFTRTPATPDAVKDAEELVTALTTRPLEVGWDWYVNLRTRDTVGNWSGGTTIGPFTILDTGKPVARALSSSGKRGTLMRLYHRAYDASGQTREKLQVYRGTRLLKTFWKPLRVTKAGVTYSTLWRAPRVPGYLRLCVQAWDASGNASVRSCARVTIR